MLDQATPQSAKLKCPAKELLVTFDSGRLVVDQGHADEEFDISGVCTTSLAVISARFDLKTFVRLGCRRLYLIPADSTEAAENLSLKFAPFKDWPETDGPIYKTRSCESATVFEDDEGSGYRFGIRPAWRVEAPSQIDPRLLGSPKLLPTGQRDALLKQMQMQAQRQKNPVAGLLVDIDVYVNRPPRPDIAKFLGEALEKCNKLVSDFSRSA